MPEKKGPKLPATFLGLPAELRVEIYELSGCLRVVSCRRCRTASTVDRVDLGFCRNGSILTQSICNFKDHGEPKQNWIVVNGNNASREYLVPLHLEDVGRLRGHRPEKIISPLEQPALTRVSRQIRSETLPMFYQDNTFSVMVDWREQALLVGALAWLSGIGTKNASMLKVLHMVASHKEDESVTARDTCVVMLKGLGVRIEAGVVWLDRVQLIPSAMPRARH